MVSPVVIHAKIVGLPKEREHRKPGPHRQPGSSVGRSGSPRGESVTTRANRRILLVAFALVAGALPLTAFGVVPKHKSSAASGPLAQTPFDVSLDRIPGGYKANDFMAVFNKMRAPARGEFETTEQYRDRLTALTGYFAFDAPAVANYKVDRGAFRIYLSEMRTYISSFKVRGRVIVDDHSGDGLGGTRAIELKRHFGKGTGYLGVNAFGVKKQVERRTDTEWGVVTDIKGPFLPSLLLEMTPQTAAEVKAFLRFLLVCHVAPLGNSALALESSEHLGPTIDSPFDVTVKHSYLVADRVWLWVFDVRTGVVFGKFALNGGDILTKELVITWPLPAARTAVEPDAKHSSTEAEEAWVRCQEAVRNKVGLDPLDFPSYDGSQLTKHEGKSFEFRSTYRYKGVGFSAQKTWRCSILFEGGVTLEVPVVQLGE
jgi:hypothetical protein